MNNKKFAIFIALFLTILSLSACSKKKETTSSSENLPAINTKLPTDEIAEDKKAEAKSELALDVYLKQVNSELGNIKTQIEDSYSDIGIVKDGTHGLRITYQMNQTYTIAEETPQQIRDSFKTLNTSILDNMRKAGVIDPTLYFVVLNGDGSAVIDEMFAE
ncbi:MAG: hypothetical protein LBV19_07820 [Streptococcaceae bacterium]|jgi:ABC-type oligopeptide transport system substrate-binding subunit|nr:hypothetical protein [Streptococcaceae bacterium]